MVLKFCNHIILLFLLISITLAQIDVPRCNSGQTDPGTGLICGRNAVGQVIDAYGYDEEWVISTKESVDGTARYITVKERKPGSDGGVAKWPPPTVSVNIYQRIRIKLINEMPDEMVTLHFHGILQKGGYVTMDGPQGITQSPILPGETFVYDFPANQAGTFWIHSHATGQYPKGLRSPLIVKDDADVVRFGYEKERDFTFTVSDWWPNFWETLKLYQGGQCGDGVEIPPARIIVNDNVKEWGNELPSKNMSVLIPPGQKARLRFINMSSFARYYIHLDTYQEDLTVIEIDGVLIKPVLTTGIELSSGQRVSITVSEPPYSSSANRPVLRKIIFVSDPRVSIGSSTKTGCRPSLDMKPSGYTGPVYTQYAYGWISNSDDVTTIPLTYNPPLTADMVHGDFSDLNAWTEAADWNAKPYMTGRPKIEFNIDKRDDSITVNGENRKIWTPKYAWKFDEFGFQPLVAEGAEQVGAWLVPAQTETFIHAILLNDTDGYGTMNLRRAGFKDTKTMGFPLMETPKYDPSQANTIGFSKLMTLMRATRSSYASGTNKKYLDVNTYSHWSHTVMLPQENAIHWFVLRAKRGDHPFHMHGHEFQLISKIPVATNPTTGNPYDFDFAADGNGKDYYNRVYQKVLEDRPGTARARRDTLMIEKGWDYVIGIKTDNPGVWAMHCHNDFHADTGMFMQLIENPKKLREDLGVWDVGSNAACQTCYEPWVSRSGLFSRRNLLNGGGIWGPWAQVVRWSMQYYGCPKWCYQYQYSDIAV